MSDRKMSMISRAEHDRIRAWFERMKPRDGKLSRVELRDGLRELDIKCTDRQLDLLLSKLDADRDGHLNYTEFAAFVGQLPTVNARAVFELFQSEVPADFDEHSRSTVRVGSKKKFYVLERIRRVPEIHLDLRASLDSGVARSGCGGRRRSASRRE